MAKYRKKPVIIEAEVYRPGLEDGFSCSAPNDHLCASRRKCDLKPEARCTFWQPYIYTLEGKHFISPGDWIITGVNGERYPCKPDVFEKTYEPVEEPVKGEGTE